VSAEYTLKALKEAIKDKNYNDLQFLLEILVRCFQTQTLEAGVMNDLFVFCGNTLKEYHAETELNSADYHANEKINLLKNTIVGTVDLAYYLKLKIPEDLSKSIDLIQDYGIKYGYSKYKNSQM
jgi:hypothetical protein